MICSLEAQTIFTNRVERISSFMNRRRVRWSPLLAVGGIRPSTGVLNALIVLTASNALPTRRRIHTGLTTKQHWRAVDRLRRQTNLHADNDGRLISHYRK
jgi:hypothetical protein